MLRDTQIFTNKDDQLVLLSYHTENTFSKESTGRHSTRGFIPTKGGHTFEKKALNPCAGNHIITEANQPFWVTNSTNVCYPV